MSVNSIWDAIAKLLNSILSSIFVFLPASPFKDTFSAMADNTVLQYLNYFIPIGDFLTITTVWLSAIAVYYAYQIVLRWIKAIND